MKRIGLMMKKYKIDLEELESLREKILIQLTDLKEFDYKLKKYIQKGKY